MKFIRFELQNYASQQQKVKVKVAHTWLPSIGSGADPGSLQSACDVSHKPGGWLPLLSARPAVTPATLKRAATNLLLGEQRHDGCEQFA